MRKLKSYCSGAELQPTHKAYHISDPKAAGLETGLLINFEKFIGVKRLPRLPS